MTTRRRRKTTTTSCRFRSVSSPRAPRHALHHAVHRERAECTLRSERAAQNRRRMLCRQKEARAEIRRSD